ncbi:MAG TPA: methyltransferase, partial [bacterium]|nr:methyltransferase [bacterium]
EREDGAFELEPMGELLRKDNPDSLRAWTQWWAHYLGPVWERLLDSVKTGESGRKLLYGTEGFEHLRRDPVAAATFSQAIAELTRLHVKDIARAYDFSEAKRIIDLGGGAGELLLEILQNQPSASGILFDLPNGIEHAKSGFDKADLAGRCELIAGDFFESIPRGGDLYLLKSILHDWNEAKSLRILENCRRAMAPKARLLVIEPVLPEKRGASAGDQALSRSDLTMLVAHGAKERTEAEFQSLLGSAGFSLSRKIAAGPAFSILECHPALLGESR